MAPISAQTYSFPTANSGLSLHQLNENLRMADSAIEQAARHLADAMNHLAPIRTGAAKRIRHQLCEQYRAVDAARRNLSLFVAQRSRELLSNPSFANSEESL